MIKDRREKPGKGLVNTKELPVGTVFTVDESPYSPFLRVHGAVVSLVSFDKWLVPLPIWAGVTVLRATLYIEGEEE